ncbi:MAG TPA: hypothetical protein ENH85_00940 [Candidatus Scalindua sp.]|nr:hypothetical protein [Candidatus Scalindua sp.]
MLTLIFGVWINLSHVAFLKPYTDTECRIEFIGDSYKHLYIKGHSCLEVAELINRMSGGKNDK